MSLWFFALLLSMAVRGASALANLPLILTLLSARTFLDSYRIFFLK